MALRVAVVFAACTLCVAGAFGDSLPEGVERTLVLPPGEDNPRNSEGDFIQLRDGRLLYIYTHFTDGDGDHASAHLASRVSFDQGKTWSETDEIVVRNEGGMNVMSVSLLRLKSGRIALLYLRKNATDDCRPLIRFSSDEGISWSEPREIIQEPVGYYVVNNDRMVQLESGRLVVPAARHALQGEEFSGRGLAMCWLSDDEGESWRRSESVVEAPEALETGMQEPAVVELKDGRLWMIARTDGGYQYQSFSSDGGETWTAAEPSNIASPVSPASIERIPSTGDLLLVWNDHEDVSDDIKGKRTPLTVAISGDEGKTWMNAINLETNPHGHYCYTAIDFIDDHFLLGHCAGDRRENNGLALSQVLRVPVGLMYDE